MGLNIHLSVEALFTWLLCVYPGTLTTQESVNKDCFSFYLAILRKPTVVQLNYLSFRVINDENNVWVNIFAFQLGYREIMTISRYVVQILPIILLINFTDRFVEIENFWP